MDIITYNGKEYRVCFFGDTAEVHEWNASANAYRKRDFKALKDWTANFQRIIENAQKSLSIIGEKNQQGAKDED